MASKAAYKRLSKEYLAMQKSPPPFIIAKPTEENILIWYYIIQGPPETPFEGGEYLGKIIFPTDYPFKPPAIKILTPNGRFQTNFSICLTMSEYHPSSWNPSWSVSSILTGLLSFMVGKENTTGSIITSEIETKQFAKLSWKWNRNEKIFKEMFPELSKLPLEIDHNDDLVSTRNVTNDTFSYYYLFKRNFITSIIIAFIAYLFLSKFTEKIILKS